MPKPQAWRVKAQIAETVMPAQPAIFQAVTLSELLQRLADVQGITAPMHIECLGEIL